jgi:hypothetical protein
MNIIIILILILILLLIIIITEHGGSRGVNIERKIHEFKV